ncbi:hypothetical protein VP01_3635g2 [Puccinia sorghi]|uniref:Uncharacterized protein n=1 Tax=Puccinia sorghi TaxID=27349 RepID=A0A0L6UWJ7_9BASI|nr:hypothetical protein VP01_3635g2 [Puccinia sorghi]
MEETLPIKIAPVEKLCNQLFSPVARNNMTKHMISPKFSNLLLRLTYFTTIVEGNSAMGGFPPHQTV